jgi:hypothetical protein
MMNDIAIRDRVGIAPDLAEVFVRAAIGGITEHGYPTPLQLEVVRQVALHVMGLTVDVDTLEPLDAAAAAELITDPALRRRLVQSIVTLELLEDPIAPALATHVRRYARTLEVDEPMVNAARHAARGHLALMYADLQRNSYYTHEATEQILDGHLWRTLRSKFAYSNVIASKAIERKWASLADMPEGSLGRATAEFYRVHHFPIPGARRGIGEIGAQHDFVHVLADYAPNPDGEINVFAFIATAMEDPKGFVQLVMTLGLFQNATITHVAGKKVVLARQGTLEEPGACARFGDALHRGSICKVDALGIDHFAIAPEPLDELRERFAIVPRQDTSQPGALDRI